MTQRLTTDNAVRAFQQQAEPYVELFGHGSLTIEYYSPDQEDLQSPHDQDEVYVVIAGHGLFQRGGDEQPFEAGEVLFVPAFMEHRFTQFSEDFATWVIFYGPSGGETDEAEE